MEINDKLSRFNIPTSQSIFESSWSSLSLAISFGYALLHHHTKDRNDTLRYRDRYELAIVNVNLRTQVINLTVVAFSIQNLLEIELEEIVLLK